MKSAEFGTFPCHISLPNALEFFVGDKIMSVTENICHFMRDVTFLNRAGNVFQTKERVASKSNII